MPHPQVTFDLSVSFYKDAIVPGILFTAIRTGHVVEPEIPQDTGAGWIGSANLGLAVQKSVGLVEISGPGHVRGDDCIIFAKHRNAIHLNRQEHGDAIFFEAPCHGEGRGAAPAVSVNDDAGILFLVRGQSPVVVRIQQAEDSLAGSSLVIALKVSTATPEGWAWRRRAASCTSL